MQSHRYHATSSIGTQNHTSLSVQEGMTETWMVVALYICTQSKYASTARPPSCPTWVAVAGACEVTAGMMLEKEEEEMRRGVEIRA